MNQQKPNFCHFMQTLNLKILYKTLHIYKEQTNKWKMKNKYVTWSDKTGLIAHFEA